MWSSMYINTGPRNDTKKNGMCMEKHVFKNKNFEWQRVSRYFIIINIVDQLCRTNITAILLSDFIFVAMLLPPAEFESAWIDVAATLYIKRSYGMLNTFYVTEGIRTQNMFHIYPNYALPFFSNIQEHLPPISSRKNCQVVQKCAKRTRLNRRPIEPLFKLSTMDWVRPADPRVHVILWLDPL